MTHSSRHSRRITRRAALVVLAACTLATCTLVLSAGAQAPPSVSPVAIEKMKALDFLAGEWKGDAWMQMGPDRREEAAQHEIVQWKSGGEALLIQGQGSTGGKVVHDALAVITWDARASRYEMWSYRAGSGALRPSIEVGDKRVVWGFDVPNGKIRYTIGLDGEGRWTEIGEHSSDGGSTWRQFFGMTLRRV